MAKRKTKTVKVPMLSAVLVWWLDAAVTPGWHDGDKLDDIKMGPVLSCGILVHANRSRIVLAMNIDGVGDAGHCFAVPRCQIIKIEATRGPEAI
jgi:hypothetical protein